MTAFTVWGPCPPKGNMARGKGAHGMYDTNAAALKKWKRDCGWSYTGMGGRLLGGPVKIEVVFYLDRPKSVTRVWPVVKPDVDKLLRTVLDSLTGAAFLDDAQVVQVTAQKRYCEDGTQARTVVEVESM